MFDRQDARDGRHLKLNLLTADDIPLAMWLMNEDGMVQRANQTASDRLGHRAWQGFDLTSRVLGGQHRHRIRQALGQAQRQGHATVPRVQFDRAFEHGAIDLFIWKSLPPAASSPHDAPLVGALVDIHRHEAQALMRALDQAGHRDAIATAPRVLAAGVMDLTGRVLWLSACSPTQSLPPAALSGMANLGDACHLWGLNIPLADALRQRLQTSVPDPGQQRILHLTDQHGGCHWTLSCWPVRMGQDLVSCAFTLCEGHDNVPPSPALPGHDTLETGIGHQQLAAWRVGHDLRTPLNTVLGYSQLFAIHPHLPAADRSKFGQLIRSATQQIESILDDLVQAPGTAHASQTPMAPVDLSRCLAQARALVGQGLDNHRLDCPLDDGSSAQVAWGMGHQPWIVEILVNLLNLATQRSEHDSIIRLSASTLPTSRQALIEVIHTERPAGGISGAQANAPSHDMVWAICEYLAQRMGGHMRRSSQPGQHCLALHLPGTTATGDHS